MKIIHKLWISFSIILIIVFAFSIGSYFFAQDVTAQAEKSRLENLKFGMLSIEAKLDVVQIQQWLTDISATRGLPGFDDGFAEAEKYNISFLQKLSLFEKYYQKSNDKVGSELIRELNKNYSSYYKIGKQMAQAYIDFGPTKGNPYMEKFDPYAAALLTTINNIVKKEKTALDMNMKQVESLGRMSSNIAFFSVLIMSITILVFSLYLSRLISKPLKELHLHLKDMVDGEGDLTCRLKIENNDEVGEVSKVFNQFISQIQTVVASIQKTSTVLGSSSESLSIVSTELRSEAQDTTVQAEDVALSTEKMSQNINSIASATQEMNSSVNSVSSSAEHMSKNMDSVTSAIEEITISIKEVDKSSTAASTIAEKGSSMAQSATEKMNVLDHASQEIGKVTEVIKRIAEQTNLLALNATIEAASAGEAGKGFAVVAGEIKELANQSAKAAEDIALKIEGVQVNTQEAVDVIEKVTNIIETINKSVTGISESVQQQSQSAGAISSNVTKANDGAKNITLSISEINKKTSDLSRNSNDGADGAKSISNSIKNVTATSKTGLEKANKLFEMAEHFLRQNVELQAQISKFKAIDE